MTVGEQANRVVVRLLQDALAEATAAYWLRRAEDFERAKPVPPPGGFADPAAARKVWRRCHETAQACRNRAALAREERDEMVAQVWAEVAA